MTSVGYVVNPIAECLTLAGAVNLGCLRLVPGRVDSPGEGQRRAGYRVAAGGLAAVPAGSPPQPALGLADPLVELVETTAARARTCPAQRVRKEFEENCGAPVDTGDFRGPTVGGRWQCWSHDDLDPRPALARWSRRPRRGVGVCAGSEEGRGRRRPRGHEGRRSMGRRCTRVSPWWVRSTSGTRRPCRWVGRGVRRWRSSRWWSAPPRWGSRPSPGVATSRRSSRAGIGSGCAGPGCWPVTCRRGSWPRSRTAPCASRRTRRRSSTPTSRAVAHKIGLAQLTRLVEEAIARFDPERAEADRLAAADARRMDVDLPRSQPRARCTPRATWTWPTRSTSTPPSRLMPTSSCWPAPPRPWTYAVPSRPATWPATSSPSTSARRYSRADRGRRRA